MKRTVTRLADGRELIYFDRRDDADRSAMDERPLPGRATASELRYDPLLDEWVAIAAHRQTRTFLPSTDDCPLCPSTPGRPTEIPASEYEVVVFENRFPAYGDGASGGRCEVVCFTSDHGRSFAELSPEQVQTVIEAWADRTAELSAYPGVEQVFCFENRGEAIGVTLHHPHGQIYGYPFVPPRTRRMLDVARRHPGDLFAEVLSAEREEGVRVVVANDLWTAFVPKAARWPYEVHVYPHRRVPDLPALDGAEREAFGALYLDLLGRLDRLFGMPLPYVSAWHQAPVRTDRDLAWLHLELFSIQRAPGKLKYLAGSESAMGAFVNDVSPEDAARRLREA
ncbi:galactose-1-phosphate uridylyltransferase [Actinomadura rudentiformis]|uniref:Galactose-1-phosphate uridylyltransferase n=1 Tax=Actinomadura rudentiformis TaxID=359158 RepID=A0A6H9YJM0_9ACTN|nr:galactose-1-phosphate uridylyltransferase [Actinomadura rudentiformis]KAB2347053.1 galactose-1-phosphate uridylyltransferase [Actinomadura rudentiformis]